ncbi:MAG: hypothetical protein ACXAC8_08850 [Candidatus Hodarchaeales archaeon]
MTTLLEGISRIERKRLFLTCAPIAIITLFVYLNGKFGNLYSDDNTFLALF